MPFDAHWTSESLSEVATDAQYEDPFEPDRPDDFMIVTTRRSLLRLALVAAETGSRFEREALSGDPVGWLLSPRRLFEGRAALEACLDREDCVHAVLLHGLSLGLDAEPTELDSVAEGLLDGDADDDDEDAVFGAKLWTSYLVVRTSTWTLHAFDAVLAGSMADARLRLCTRHGAQVAHALDIMEGFDPSMPLAVALVSPALADQLQQVASDPTSPLARGLTVSLKQRFAE